MAREPNKLDVVLSLIDKATAPLRAFNQRVERIQEPVRKVSNQLALLGREAGLSRLGERMGGIASAARSLAGEVAKIGVAGLGAGFAFKRAFVDVAAEFERFELVLETIEGGRDKAQRSMQWISEFAAKTPYELADVTEAFVKLRAYGMEPTNGLLKTLGDTAAAMDKPLMQAVEAIADAITGENERLKEFGIRAEKAGDYIVYTYTAQGKTMRARAKANNRAQIQDTLAAIWNQKYAGAMDKLSGGWGGMMSNLADQWTRFAKMVMDSGPFQAMKTRLANLLAQIDSMAASGELAKIAAEWGERITSGLAALWDAGKQVWAFLSGFVNTVGGVGNALKIVAAIAAGPLVLALLQLGQAFVALGATMMAAPLGWVIAGVAAAAAGIALLTANADSLGGTFGSVFGVVGSVFGTLFDTLKELAQLLAPVVLPILKAIGAVLGGAVVVGVMAVVGALKVLMTVLQPAVWLIEKILSAGSWLIEKVFGGGGAENVQAAAGRAQAALEAGPPVGALPVAAAGAPAAQTVTQNARVEVDFRNVPRGVTVTPDARGSAPLDLSMGYAMVAP